MIAARYVLHSLGRTYNQLIGNELRTIVKPERKRALDKNK